MDSKFDSAALSVYLDLARARKRLADEAVSPDAAIGHSLHRMAKSPSKEGN
ncbi:hypothetical protein AB0D11_23260 [Streptomyces monashensis]|uniref:hypothetical protein n=1 Tax=Streptomyces monashensis TaxID=1678012 RepID=UPI0033EF807F